MLLLHRPRFGVRASLGALVAIVALIALCRSLSSSFGGGASVGKCARHSHRSLLRTYQIYGRSSEEEASLQGDPQRAQPLDYRAPVASRWACARALVIVHSRSSNFEQRARLRRAFRDGSDDSFDFAPPLFVLSTRAVDAQLARTLERERAEFDDLLELSGIEDHYHNITYKPRAWIDHLARQIRETKCQRAKFVVKMDVDVFVDVAALSELLTQFSAHKRIVACRVFPNGQVTRNNASKWYLSKEEYRPSSLGLYCQGMAYVFSVDLLPQMLENIDRVQYLWMDDWYVTHALMNATRAAFYDVAPHVVSVDSAAALRDKLAARRRTGANAPVPIFAHFRPDEEFPEKQKEKIWAEISANFTVCSENGNDNKFNLLQ